MTGEANEKSGAQFTRRLEAFSDLVFGFSLSLLATRLDVPANPDEIFSSARWLPIAGTFALICRFWLEHYRVFRHDFVAKGFDAIVNFIFLFAIAVFPYAVQTFLKFQRMKGPFALYTGDLILVFITLSTLRLRGLRQRRNDPDMAGRLKDWRRSVTQMTIALGLGGVLLSLRNQEKTLEVVVTQSAPYLLGLIALIVLSFRFVFLRLPRFLS